MSRTKDLIPIIKWLAVDLDEVVIDMQIYDLTFNSIEWRRKGNQVILHRMVNGLDIEFNYDEMDKEIQEAIYIAMLKILN